MYDEETMINEANKKKKPVGTWIIGLYYIIGSIMGLYSLYIIKSGKLPLTQEQISLAGVNDSIIFWGTILLSLLNIASAVLLILLRKQVIPFICFVYLVSLAFTAYQWSLKNWTGILSGPTAFGQIFGWIVMIIVLIYIFRLKSKKLLK